MMRKVTNAREREWHNCLPCSNFHMSKVLEQNKGDFQPIGSLDLHRSFQIHHYRCPPKMHNNPLTVLKPEECTIQKIVVDLRPALGQVLNTREEGYNSSDSSSDPPLVWAKTLELQEAVKEQHEMLSPSQGTTSEEFRMYLPPIAQSQVENLESPVKLARLSLASVSNNGTITCHPEDKSGILPPVCFPKIIVSQEPMKKMPEKQGQERNMSARWLGVEKLQLPLSELVKVISKQTEYRHHTFINQVLHSLRERR
ncbi:hypothetical protein XELAEV_18006244mg [Xenopus laevis]|uniref:Uncharacterized protein n=1 Tax=Xenopus laevis TaxID=8355 RepID=A0A974E097_XENLA|nr:hypothetical protein XELAEV_18006244mg [Xenopus laevis]